VRVASPAAAALFLGGFGSADAVADAIAEARRYGQAGPITRT